MSELSAKQETLACDIDRRPPEVLETVELLLADARPPRVFPLVFRHPSLTSAIELTHNFHPSVFLHQRYTQYPMSSADASTDHSV